MRKKRNSIKKKLNNHRLVVVFIFRHWLFCFHIFFCIVHLLISLHVTKQFEMIFFSLLSTFCLLFISFSKLRFIQLELWEVFIFSNDWKYGKYGNIKRRRINSNAYVMCDFCGNRVTSPISLSLFILLLRRSVQ